MRRAFFYSCQPASLIPRNRCHGASWYGLLAWKKRQRYQLREHPLCAACLESGFVTAATVADHNPPHEADWNAFRLGPLQSLCVACHERKHNRAGVFQVSAKTSTSMGSRSIHAIRSIMADPDDDYDFPPATNPVREFVTASLFILAIIAILVWAAC